MLTSGKRSKARLNICHTGVVFILAAILLVPAVALGSEKRLVDDGEYKDNFRKCIISDYSNMVDGGDVHWVWVDPSVKLSGYKLKEGKVENKSEIRSRSMVDMVKNLVKDTFADMEGKEKGTLTADVCIYWAENFSGGKAWIPFVGGHQMQAGIGMEWVLRDGKRTVAKFRHDAREGVQIEAAAQEVVGDLMKYIGDH